MEIWRRPCRGLVESEEIGFGLCWIEDWGLEIGVRGGRVVRMAWSRMRRRGLAGMVGIN
jgi:uncharacterized OB-fold protein